ncbi:MAG: hypothetical protein RLY45_216, partial [Actinomycetota bacterium]
MSANGSASLDIRGLRIEVADNGNDIVDGVDLVIRRGEVLG